MGRSSFWARSSVISLPRLPVCLETVINSKLISPLALFRNTWIIDQWEWNLILVYHESQGAPRILQLEDMKFKLEKIKYNEITSKKE
jgi:hypothetical protein